MRCRLPFVWSMYVWTSVNCEGCVNTSELCHHGPRGRVNVRLSHYPEVRRCISNQLSQQIMNLYTPVIGRVGCGGGLWFHGCVMSLCACFQEQSEGSHSDDEWNGDEPITSVSFTPLFLYLSYSVLHLRLAVRLIVLCFFCYIVRIHTLSCVVLPLQSAET